MTTHKVYVDTENLSREQLEQLLIDKEKENKKLKAESEELKMWLREELPLALLKEYMNKFEWVED